MRHIGFGQFLVLLLLCFLLFGDFSSFKTFIVDTGKSINLYFSRNNRGKGN